MFTKSSFGFTRGGKRYDFQIERGGNPNLAWIGTMNLKILLCFLHKSMSCVIPKENGIFVYLFFDIMLCHKEKFKFLAPIHAK